MIEAPGNLNSCIENSYRIAEFFFFLLLFFFSQKFSPSCSLLFNLFTIFFWYKTTKAPSVSFGKFVFFRFSINRKSFTVTIISRFPSTAQALFSPRFQTFENIFVDLAFVSSQSGTKYFRTCFGGSISRDSNCK